MIRRTRCDSLPRCLRAGGNDVPLMEDEFATFAVEPSKVYWVFVGADDSTTGQPIDYDLTVCGGRFTP